MKAFGEVIKIQITSEEEKKPAMGFGSKMGKVLNEFIPGAYKDKIPDDIER